jgi:hypothetical protein
LVVVRNVAAPLTLLSEPETPEVVEEEAIAFPGHSAAIAASCAFSVCSISSACITFFFSSMITSSLGTLEIHIDRVNTR